MTVEQGPAEKSPFTGILTGVANHEAKLAVASIMLDRQDVWFSAAALHSEVMSRQGENPGWRLANSGEISYCSYSLAPVGLVAKGQVASGGENSVTAYKANTDRPDVLSLGKAMGGALLDWSLEVPEISLQQVFGVTAKKGIKRTPELRYFLYRTLLENSASTMTYADLTRELGPDYADKRTLHVNVHALAAHGILATRTFDAATDATLEIVKPESYHDLEGYKDLKFETKLIYQVMAKNWSNGNRLITFADLAAEATAQNPDMDLRELRRIWSMKTSTGDRVMSGLRVVSRTIAGKSKTSDIKISPLHEDSIFELMVRLDNCETGNTDAMHAYQQMNKEIIGNPVKVARLFAKAKQFSSSAKGTEEGVAEINKRITALLTSSGELSVADIAAGVKAGGRTISRASVTRYLRGLKEKGIVQVDVRRTEDKSRLQKVQYYSLADAE